MSPDRKRPRRKRRGTRRSRSGGAAPPGDGVPSGAGPTDAQAPAAGLRTGRARDGEVEDGDAETLRLAELIRDDLIELSLKASDQWGAVRELIDVLIAAKELPRTLDEVALQATREREAIRPTGWKYGLAFPNGRVAGLRRIVAAVGVSRTGIEFGCRDELPARVVVLLLFPEARYARFAPAIQDIADTMEDPAVREAILNAKRPDEVVDVLEDAETRDFS